ncbi:MAG: translation initiation factor [Cyanobacteria bacterium J06635_1]
MSKRKRTNPATDRPPNNRIAYSEFGPSQSAAFEQAVPDLPPQQQDLRVQVSRKGRKGKSVTIISGFSHKPETLTKLAKTLKAQCGSGGTLKEDTIEIQGEHGPKLVTLLTEKGYKSQN